MILLNDKPDLSWNRGPLPGQHPLRACICVQWHRWRWRWRCRCHRGFCWLKKWPHPDCQPAGWWAPVQRSPLCSMSCRAGASSKHLVNTKPLSSILSISLSSSRTKCKTPKGRCTLLDRGFQVGYKPWRQNILNEKKNKKICSIHSKFRGANFTLHSQSPLSA